MRPDRDRILISCEHASNAVPDHYRSLFSGQEALFKTHAAYDIGAAELAKVLAKELKAPLFKGQWTRLLVDLNRSEKNKKALFSDLTRSLSGEEREKLLAHYYHPYRRDVETRISSWLAKGQKVLHLSIHSFTPVKEGSVRNADVGLLYDPSRTRDRLFCRQLKAALGEIAPALKVRMNYPYLGRSDGFAPSLRKVFSPEDYMGIEIEMNQALSQGGDERWGQLKKSLGKAIAAS